MQLQRNSTPIPDSVRLGIIIPSFKDHRIIHAISSVTNQDPKGVTRLYIIDGGSDAVLLDAIDRHLRPHDYFISEKDSGIFDALNKGLDATREPYVGWIGSDDFFTRDIDFSEVCQTFEAQQIDCYLCDLIFVDGAHTCRRTRAISPEPTSMLLGKHIQHFSSFWRMATIANERFDLKYRIASDIEFFYRLSYLHALKAHITHKVSTIARLGGNSTRGLRRIFSANAEVYHICRVRMNPATALFATTCKLLRKWISQFTVGQYEIIDEMTSLITKM